MGIQTSVDGFRLAADRTGAYTGSEESWAGPDGDWKDVWLGVDPPAAAKVVVYKGEGTKGFAAVATWSEYVQTNKDGKPSVMWARMPARMLAKCAESLALRKAFPAELSGLYTSEEMAQAENGAPARSGGSHRAPGTSQAPSPPDVDPETGEVAPPATTRRPPPGRAKAIDKGFAKILRLQAKQKGLDDAQLNQLAKDTLGVDSIEDIHSGDDAFKVQQAMSGEVAPTGDEPF
jgi:hypothetical protein